MNLAIVGYGKMGKLIDSLASEYDFTTVLRLDVHNNAHGEMFTPQVFEEVDVAIEFSTPETALVNIEKLCKLKINSVIGTTGWLDHLPEVKTWVEEANIGLVWSPNFSIGVNLFMKLIEEAAKLFANEEEYEAFAYEMHHSAKLDAPSGTLVKIVEDMKVAGYNRKIDVASSRVGKVPGTHRIGFDSTADTIELVHTARNREGFARGALKAARFIAGTTGFYEFSDIILNR